MACASISSYKTMSSEDKRYFNETRHRIGLQKYIDRIRDVTGLHERSSSVVNHRLSHQGEEYDMFRMSHEDPETRLRFPKRDECCVKCHRNGFNVQCDDDSSYCVMGCIDCVRDNGWCWGEFLRPSQYGIPGPDPEAPSDWIKIPCNGIREGRDAEMTNLEVILMLLNEVWDSHPDHDPPKWRDFFDKAPNHIHMVVCETLRLWTSPEIIRDWDMDAGHYMFFQALYSDWMDEQTYDGEYEVEDEESLQPRVLFPEPEDEPGVEKRKQLCREGQALLDNGEEFNEEKYRQLCNLFMKIHRD